MPSLLESLQSEDIGQLFIIAEFWGLNLYAPDVRTGRKNLTSSILNKQLIIEIIESLKESEAEAIQLLLENDLRYSWKQFKELYGDIREIGAAKRDREKLYLKPISSTEKLWYLGLIHRAFFDIENNPKEMVFIPDDLAALIPRDKKEAKPLLVRPAKPEERQEVILVNDHIVDDICTLFAALRISLDSIESKTLSSILSTGQTELLSLMLSLDYINENNEVDPLLVRDHLKLSREEAFHSISTSWIKSHKYNDLLHVPGLVFEGEWQSYPYKSRQAVIDHLKNLPTDTWWNISTFISSIKRSDPEFLRQSNDYDNWYIRKEESGQYLKGFENWDSIEGEYLHYLFTGPLYWFGIVDLAGVEKGSKAISFRLSRMSANLFANQVYPTNVVEKDEIYINSKLILDIPRNCQRTIRYHLSRFCEWEGMVRDNYRDRITTESLQHAQDQGLKVDQLLKLLQKHSASRLSKNVIKAIKRWDEQGIEASIGHHLILRVHNPEILKELKRSKAARFLGDSLSPTSAIVNPGAWSKVQKALGELGVLTEIELEEIKKKKGPLSPQASKDS